MSSKNKKAKKSSKNKNLGKVERAKRGILKRVEQINSVINRLELEIEGLVKKLVKQGERSRKELRRNFDDLIARLGAKDLIALASETRDDVEREVRRLAEEVLDLVKEIERVPARINLGGLITDARRSFEDVVDHLNDNDLIQRAKQTLNQTKKEVLSLLSIPTQDEVVKLERKIVTLEKRLSNLSRKAA